MGFRIKIERRARSRFPEELRERQARLAGMSLELGMTASAVKYQCAIFQLDTQNHCSPSGRASRETQVSVFPFVVTVSPMLQNDEAHVRQASDIS